MKKMRDKNDTLQGKPIVRHSCMAKFFSFKFPWRQNSARAEHSPWQAHTLSTLNFPVCIL